MNRRVVFRGVPPAPVAEREQQPAVLPETSGVGRLTGLGAQADVPIEPGLLDLLALAARLSKETGGAFDITAGPLVKAWGFYRREGRIPSDCELAAALEKV